MVERLSESRTVVLDGTGSGVAFFAPGKFREVWRVSRITTRGTSSAEPTLRVYRGAAGGQMLDNTQRANGDISETDIEIRDGEQLSAVYEGGTPASEMYLVIEGEINRGV